MEFSHYNEYGVSGYTLENATGTLKDSKEGGHLEWCPAKFDTTWGGNNLLHHRSNSKIMWNNWARDVGLVDRA